MEDKYRGIREVTPEKMRCSIAACPAIYEAVREVTPEKMRCAISACHAVYEASKGEKNVYLVVGNRVNPADAGLAGKVGKGEVLIEVPCGLINGMGR